MYTICIALHTDVSSKLIIEKRTENSEKKDDRILQNFNT